MSQRRPILETVATVLLTTAAVVVASVYVYTQLLDGRAPRGGVMEVDQVENWREETALGIRIGPADARMIVTEFMDFTCPYCAQMVPAIDSLLARYPDEVALVFQHFPLEGRPQSRPSAVMAECAYSDEVVHPFRAKPSSCSGPSCPPVPGHAVQG